MKAFPLSSPRDLSRPADNKVNPLERGMDLRDYFAIRVAEYYLGKSISKLDAAEKSYALADAMMIARTGEVEQPKFADPVLNAIETEIEETPKPAKKVSKK